MWEIPTTRGEKVIIAAILIGGIGLMIAALIVGAVSAGLVISAII